MIKLNSSKV